MAGRFRSSEKSNVVIRNRTRSLLAGINGKAIPVMGHGGP
jgi:hypothetical protein